MERHNEIMERAQALETVLLGHDAVPRAPFDSGSRVVAFVREVQIMRARISTMQVPFLHLTSSRPL